jgi:hypothetical protein
MLAGDQNPANDTARLTIHVAPNRIEPFLNNNVLVYPNPVTNGQLTIDNGQLPINNVEIFDMTGKRVYSVQIPFTIHHSPLTINISHLPAGNYTVRIHTETAIIPIKIVKQ